MCTRPTALPDLCETLEPCRYSWYASSSTNGSLHEYEWTLPHTADIWNVAQFSVHVTLCRFRIFLDGKLIQQLTPAMAGISPHIQIDRNEQPVIHLGVLPCLANRRLAVVATFRETHENIRLVVKGMALLHPGSITEWSYLFCSEWPIRDASLIDLHSTVRRQGMTLCHISLILPDEAPSYQSISLLCNDRPVVNTRLPKKSRTSCTFHFPEGLQTDPGLRLVTKFTADQKSPCPATLILTVKASLDLSDPRRNEALVAQNWEEDFGSFGPPGLNFSEGAPSQAEVPPAKPKINPEKAMTPVPSSPQESTKTSRPLVDPFPKSQECFCSRIFPRFTATEQVRFSASCKEEAEKVMQEARTVVRDLKAQKAQQLVVAEAVERLIQIEEMYRISERLGVFIVRRMQALPRQYEGDGPRVRGVEIDVNLDVRGTAMFERTHPRLAALGFNNLLIEDNKTGTVRLDLALVSGCLEFFRTRAVHRTPELIASTKEEADAQVSELLKTACSLARKASLADYMVAAQRYVEAAEIREVCAKYRLHQCEGFTEDDHAPVVCAHVLDASV